MQLARFEEAFSEQVHADLDAEHRRRLNEDSDNSRAWRESTDANYEPFDPRRPLRVPSWALYLQVSAELDLLIVAVRNVLRAQDRLPEQARTSMGDQYVVELLRNVAEHWDEVGGRSRAGIGRGVPDGPAGCNGIHEQRDLDRRLRRHSALADHCVAVPSSRRRSATLSAGTACRFPTT